MFPDEDNIGDKEDVPLADDGVTDSAGAESSVADADPDAVIAPLSSPHMIVS